MPEHEMDLRREPNLLTVAHSRTSFSSRQEDQSKTNEINQLAQKMRSNFNKYLDSEQYVELERDYGRLSEESP